MWELLQKIEKLGWKPYGKSIAELSETEKNVRLITSRNSLLWQFVCGNNLIQTEHGCFIDNGERAKNVFYKVDKYDEEGDIIQTGDMEGDKFIGIYEPEYRIIESALCNEEDLEKFLLDNIKV